jgi:hypothetical protein
MGHHLHGKVKPGGQEKEIAKSVGSLTDALFYEQLVRSELGIARESKHTSPVIAVR